MKKLLLAATIIALAGSALADETKMAKVAPDDLKWGGNPAVPKGVSVAIITGDPTKAGTVVVQRVKFEPNTMVPPHTHPYDEVVTILSGNVAFAMGDKMDLAAPMDKPGTFIVNPARNPHYVKNGGEESIIQVQFIAPGGIDYVDPADDPRKK